ncbi:hypothetical protein GW17_00022112 [Ensete ventricosum]|nr:hypothetical protein GW17_00022112 [Ensete ventricosum]
MIGEGPGAGYNINIPWEHGQCSDADYIAAWDHVRHELKGYWPVLDVELPQNLLITNSRPCPPEVLNRTYSSSESDVENDEGAARTINVSEFAEDDVLLPLSKLKIDEDNHGKVIASDQVQEEGSLSASEASHDAELMTSNEIVDGYVTWRSLLSKVEVWYASYGSNMWKPRFLCYIEGGKVEGMSAACCGSLDKSSPKDVIWKIVPHRLLFGRSHTRTWGAGGVAFLDPERSTSDRAYLCMYRITYLSMLMQDGWYSTVLYLEKEDDLPILTMTYASWCSASDVERFKSGELPASAPAKDYMNTLVNGLVEGKQLTREEAVAYVNGAAT